MSRFVKVYLFLINIIQCHSTKANGVVSSNTMCGVMGIIGAEKAALEVFLGLSVLQHRGQDAAGISSYDSLSEPSLNLLKGLGLVNRVFNQDQVEQLKGSIALGHTRYATVGKKGDLRNIQPMITNFPLPLALCHNGNLVNYFDLKESLKKDEGFSPLSGSDLEIIIRIFISNLIKNGNGLNPPTVTKEELAQAAFQVQERCVGAYSIVGFLGDQILFGFCDPHGIRPLVFGKRIENGKESFAFSSEDSGLNFLGFERLFDVEPGEFVAVDQKGQVLRKKLNQKPLKACMFEWVYFAGAESQIRSLPVYRSRLELGRSLGRMIQEDLVTNKIHIDFVSPVPETSRTAAISLAETIQKPYREALIKNRYIQRSFIMNLPGERAKAVELKLSPIPSEIKDKNLLLVDDSIVRGTTLRRIIQLVRKAGAKKVYVASTCPPIRHGCFYGIDFPDPEKLVAKGRTIKEIENELGADGIFYLTLEDLKTTLNGNKLCTGCLTGEYPTSIESAKKFSEKRNSVFEGELP